METVITTTTNDKLVVKRNGFRDKVIKMDEFIDPPKFDKLRKKLRNIDVGLLTSMKDVFFNHDQEQLQVTLDGENNLKTYWRFTLDKDNPGICRIERWEADGSGKGMTMQTATHEFTRTLDDDDRDDSKGGGIHSVGEKLFFELCIKYMELLTERGQEVCTRTEGMDKWYWHIYDPTNNNMIDRAHLTDDEAKAKGIPVDRIGKVGTYTSQYFSTKGLDDNWFEQLQHLLNLHFMDSFKIWWDATLEFDKNDPILTPEVVKLEGNIVAGEGCGPNPPIYKEKMMDFYKKEYRTEVLVRAAMGTKESQDFDQKYGSRRAFKDAEGINSSGLRGGKLGDNLVVMIMDKERGYCYEIVGIMSGNKQRRGVMRIFVDKDDLDTDVAKSKAQLKAKDGFKTKATQNKKILEFWANCFPVVVSTEQELRNQIVNILHGVKWPDWFTFHTYKELCKVFECPVGDYDYARKYITTNHPVMHKKLDIYNSDTDHIFELKRSEPDGDNDLNQIITYQSIMGSKKVTMVAVSRSKNTMISSVNGEFHPDKRSLYTSTISAWKPEVEWNLVDLRYFGLHEMADKFKEVQ